MMRAMHPTRNSGSALGFMNMMNMVGGAVGQPLVGWVLDLTWHGALLHNARIYSTISYQMGLSILPIMIAISIMLLFKLQQKSSALE